MIEDRPLKPEPEQLPTPKYLAQKCPVCNGFGTVSFKRILCHACGGKGFLEIPIKKEE